jgi:hypothetical protein
MIAKNAASFAIPFLPGVYFFTISSLLMEYADTNRKRAYSILAFAVGLTTLLASNYKLVVKGSMKLKGVGIASSISGNKTSLKLLFARAISTLKAF